MSHSAVKFIGGIRKHSELCNLKLKNLPRIVFAGRSNVGKSSLLNSITKSKAARVSQTPGKTQEMNFFEWNLGVDPVYLVDLPGYGFAKTSKDLRQEWGSEITSWLKKDSFIMTVCVLVDGRHGFFEKDLDLLSFLKKSGVQSIVSFTKMDKWKSNNQYNSAKKGFTDFCIKLGVHNYAFTSSEEKNGLKGLIDILRETIKCWKVQR